MIRRHPLRSIALFALILAAMAVNPQERGPRLSEKEIRVLPVEFINRARRMPASSRAVRAEQLRRGNRASADVRKGGKADVLGFTFERVYAPTAKGFGADIMRIKPRANYGHIAHIQRVLAGYLQGAFEYKTTDAMLLARFLLYYNARLRGQMAQVKAKYSGTVAGKVRPALVGIDRSYRGWPGRTELLLPLRKSSTRPGKTDIDPDEVRKNSGKVGPKENKAIKDLVNRRREEDKKALDDKQKDLDKKKETIDKRKGEVKESLKKLEKQITKMREDPKRNAQEIKKAEAREKELKKEQKTLAKEEKKVAKEVKEVAEEKKSIAKQEEQAKKEEKAEATKTSDDPSKKETKTTKEEDRKKIAEDIKKELKKSQEEKSETVVGTRILFLRVLRYFNGGHYNNELWFIDAAKNDAVFRGPFTQICGRSFLVVPNLGVLVIGYGGESHTDTEHKLMLLDAKTLDVKSGTKEFVFWRSPLIYRDDKLYIVEIYKDRHYLSRFNKDMTLEVRSSEPVSPDSDITFYEDRIYLTGKAQTGQATTIQVFKRADLKLSKTITPGS